VDVAANKLTRMEVELEHVQYLKVIFDRLARERSVKEDAVEDWLTRLRVKLIEHEEETYVLARSQGRRNKEQSMRRRRLKKLIRRLRELQQQDLTRDELLLKLGAAKKEAGKAYTLLVIHTLLGKEHGNKAGYERSYRGRGGPTVPIHRGHASHRGRGILRMLRAQKDDAK
jgi:hypothetical protein